MIAQAEYVVVSMVPVKDVLALFSARAPAFQEAKKERMCV